MTALWLLLAQGIIGAFDTIYYHEWRARLPAFDKSGRELRLHAVRDCIYAVLFMGLALFEWRGSLSWVIVAAFIAEIVVTMWDFAVEASVRKPLGDVYPGERITHGLMGIVYGAMLAVILPQLVHWGEMPTGLIGATYVYAPMKWALIVMGIGVALSGARDFAAAGGVRGASWPWRRYDTVSESTWTT